MRWPSASSASGTSTSRPARSGGRPRRISCSASIPRRRCASTTSTPASTPTISSASAPRPARAIDTGSVYDVEHRIVTPLGLEKWVHERATVERAADGTPTRLVGVVRDISDTRLAEEALRASRGRLQAIVENMPVLMTALDDDGHFVFWNTRVRARHRLHRRRGARRRQLHPSLHPGPDRAGADAPRRAAAGRGVPRLGADDHLQGRHEADHRLVEHLRRVPAAGVVDVGGRRRRHRAQAARGAVPAVAEDGGDRPPRRRHRPRLQQPAHRRAGLHRRHPRRDRRRRTRTGRRSSRSSAPASAPRP